MALESGLFLVEERRMELVRKARAEQPEMEVIVLTAYGPVETAVEAMKLGAFDYLPKPLSSPGELRLLASRALERRSLLALRGRADRETPGEEPLTWGDPAMAPASFRWRRRYPTPQLMRAQMQLTQ